MSIVDDIFAFSTTPGREIDEYGNVVKSGAALVKTLAANVAVEKANKKKENPYLAHRVVPSAGDAVHAVGGLSAAASTADPTAPSTAVLDERLPHLRRDLRARKGLHFIEAGKFIDEADKIKAKEERKIIAGYASGRKNIQHHQVLSCIVVHNTSTYKTTDTAVPIGS